MAIAPTGAIYKSLSFDNTSSRNYGVYITGEAVYNAPERDVEMVTIPGRNGAFALDNGRFENITVSYPAGIYANTEADFAQAVSDFRNFLCSKKGYCRLTDEYNPNEYRMAVYKSGLEVSPAQLRAGEFTIEFECKPQRFLTSGETAVAIANNGTLNNPTLFDAKPLFQFNGHGKLSIGSTDITVDDVPLGEYVLYSSSKEYISITSSATTASISMSFDDYFVNANDALTLKNGLLNYSCYASDSTSQAISDTDTTHFTSRITGIETYGSRWAKVETRVNDLSFVAGTAASYSNTCSITFTYPNTPQVTVPITLQISYDGVETITYTITRLNYQTTSTSSFYMTVGDLYADSTVSVLSLNTAYIDFDIGECYMIRSGEMVQLNSVTHLPPELPVLPPGNTTITYDNTFTSMKVVPRWWKV